jgi:hypothetical protein
MKRKGREAARNALRRELFLSSEEIGYYYYYYYYNNNCVLNPCIRYA